MEINVFGRTLHFDGHADIYLNHLSSGGEENFLKFAETYVENGSVVLDIGANIGFVSAVFSLANPDGRIYAIEPGEANFQFLKGNIVSNSLENVSAFKMAVSNFNGFQAFKENSAWGHLDDQAMGDTEVTTLDDFVRSNSLERVDIVKIDVEGFEQHVLDGMQETIAKFNPRVIFEFNAFCMLSYGKVNPIDFMEKISTSFGNIFRFDKSSNAENLLIPCSRDNFAIEALHQNVAIDGSVNDYLVYN